MFHSHMRFYITQWSATRFYGSLSVYLAAPSPKKKSPRGSPVKIAFRPFLFLIEIVKKSDPANKSDTKMDPIPLPELP